MAVQVIRIKSIREATISERTGVFYYVTGPPICETTVDPVSGDVTMKTSSSVMPLYTYPTGSKITEYEDTEIECDECHARFPASKLEFEETFIGDDYGEAYSFDVCPKCNAWDCCETRKETIDEYKERTKDAS